MLLRYLAWHWSVPLPANGLAEAVWSHAFLALESLSVLSNLLVLFFMSRTLDRSPEADAGRDSPLQGAPVDVFVCTYNEGTRSWSAPSSARPGSRTPTSASGCWTTGRGIGCGRSPPTWARATSAA